MKLSAVEGYAFVGAYAWFVGDLVGGVLAAWRGSYGWMVASFALAIFAGLVIDAGHRSVRLRRKGGAP